MSWILGRSNRQQVPQDGALPEGDQGAGQPAAAPLSSAEKKAMEAYRFDSSALERAAQAAKTLEQSSKSGFHS